MEREGYFGGAKKGPRLLIPQPVLAQVQQVLHAGLPLETGGLLFGEKLDDDFCVSEFIALKNAADSPTCYMAAPQELIQAVLTAHSKGYVAVATLHSHPQGSATPSLRDLQEAFGYQDVLHVIAARKRTKFAFYVYTYSKNDERLTYEYAPLIITEL